MTSSRVDSFFLTEESPEKNGKFLHFRSDDDRVSDRIEKLVSSKYFVYENSPILQVAEEMKKENANSAGVVNSKGHALGIVVRQSLLNLLSRQYGREILKTGRIDSVMTECRQFDKDTNIFTVADLISHEMDSDEYTYYLINDSEYKFRGIFSTNDMLVYLSGLTRRDIDLAKIIQKGIIKEFFYQEDKDFEIVCSAIMAQTVGGDFYSFQRTDDNKVLLTLCDVSGKGVAASLVTAFIYGMIYNFKYYPKLKDFVSELNSMFIKTFDLEKYLTGQFIVLDPDASTFRVCEMGHPFAYRFEDNQLLPIFENSSNLPVGVALNIDIQEFEYRLNPGDILLFVTDGFVEQTDSHGNEILLDNIAGIFKKYKSLPLNTMAVRVLEYFHSFRKKMPLKDDVTFIILKKK